MDASARLRLRRGSGGWRISQFSIEACGAEAMTAQKLDFQMA
jgi:hypothetical protein